MKCTQEKKAVVKENVRRGMIQNNIFVLLVGWLVEFVGVKTFSENLYKIQKTTPIKTYFIFQKKSFLLISSRSEDFEWFQFLFISFSYECREQ